MRRLEKFININFENIMARVVAPLQSFSASGQVGGSLVFFSHLGRNVVRALVTPRNARSETQGDVRLLLGAIGRACSAVVRPASYYNDLINVVPAGQTWVSYMQTLVQNHFGTGNIGVAALKAAESGSTPTNWDSLAAGLGLSALTIPYANSTDQTLSAGTQLYALAQAAFNIRAVNPTLFNRAPYTTAFASWDDAEVTSFVTDLTTVV